MKSGAANGDLARLVWCPLILRVSRTPIVARLARSIAVLKSAGWALAMSGATRSSVIMRSAIPPHQGLNSESRVMRDAADIDDPILLIPPPPSCSGYVNRMCSIVRQTGRVKPSLNKPW